MTSTKQKEEEIDDSWKELPYLGYLCTETKIQEHTFNIPNYYKVGKIIGRGAYSIVFGAIDTRDNEAVAIKKIKASIFNDQVNTLRILREINLLRQVSHESVITLREIIPPKNVNEFTDCYIVFDRQQTDLNRLIHSTSKYQLSHIKYMGYQIVRALKYLHSLGIVHRDLKPSNILVNLDCNIQICDFGLSRKVTNTGPMTRHVATRWWRAPEIMCWDEYNKPVDVWAAGCIIVELYTRKILFPGEHLIHQLDLIFEKIGSPNAEDRKNVKQIEMIKYFEKKQNHNNKVVNWNDYLKDTLATPDVCDLLSKILIFNPLKRITTTEILKHKYFIDWHDEEDEQDAPYTIEQCFTDSLKSNKQMLWDEMIKVREANINATDIDGTDSNDNNSNNKGANEKTINKNEK